MCLLDPLPSYFNISSAFFNEKESYLDFLDKNERDHTIIYGMFKKKMKIHCAAVMQHLKPRTCNLAQKVVKVNDVNAVITLPEEIHLSVKTLPETLDVFYFTSNTLWFTFTSWTEVTAWCGLTQSDFMKKSGQDSEISVLIGESDCLQFKYSRKTHKLWLQQYKYVTKKL